MNHLSKKKGETINRKCEYLFKGNEIIENNAKEIENIKEFNLKFSDEIKIDDNLKHLFKKIFVIEPKQRIELNEILNILLDKN